MDTISHWMVKLGIKTSFDPVNVQQQQQHKANGVRLENLRKLCINYAARTLFSQPLLANKHMAQMTAEFLNSQSADQLLLAMRDVVQRETVELRKLTDSKEDTNDTLALNPAHENRKTLMHVAELMEERRREHIARFTMTERAKNETAKLEEQIHQALLQVGNS